MGLLSWILFGALAGWAASKIYGSDRRSGCITNILIGVIGAFLGGQVMNFVYGRPFYFSFDVKSFGVAILGAIVLLVIVGRKKS